MLRARDVQLEADMQMSMIERDMASWDLLQGFPEFWTGDGTKKQALPPTPFLSRLTRLGPL